MTLHASAQQALRQHVQQDWRARRCRLILDAKTGDTLFCVKSAGIRARTVAVNLKNAKVVVPSRDATAGEIYNFVFFIHYFMTEYLTNLIPLFILMQR
mgnify:FL=1